MKYISVISLLFASCFVLAQETFPVNGIADERPEVYAFTNATIHKDYQTVIGNGTLLIQKGIVVDVGTQISLPKDAVVIDLKGLHIYPSFIDLYTDYGLEPVKKPEGDAWKQARFDSGKKGAFGWNEAIKPEVITAGILEI